MSAAITISVQDNGTPEIERLVKSVAPERLEKAVGPAVNKFTQQHLLRNGTNRRGWPTTNFWSRAAKATSWTGSGRGSVTVSINQVGVRQRWKGGVIKPVNARALTIPISPVSYGHVASEFSGLFLLKTEKGAYLVQPGQEISEKSNKFVKRKGGGNEKRRQRATLNFLFKLVDSVSQKPNPEAIPSDDQLLEVSLGAVERLVIV